MAENEPSGTTVGTFSTTDPDTGNTFTYSLVGGTGDSDNASFTISGSTLKTAASFDYETKNSYAIRVRSTDNGGLFFEQAFTISVSDVNENVAPSATNDDVSTDEDTALSGNVLANDSDNNGDTLTAIKLSDPQHGTLTLNGNGSFSYTPDANYNGPDSFSYKANDGALDSNVATVSITVNAVNDAPTATSDSVSTDEDTAKGITLAANDGQRSLTYFVVGAPTHGTLSGTAQSDLHAECVYSSPGSFVQGRRRRARLNVATVGITVNAVNDAPRQPTATAERGHRARSLPGARTRRCRRRHAQRGWQTARYGTLAQQQRQLHLHAGGGLTADGFRYKASDDALRPGGDGLHHGERGQRRADGRGRGGALPTDFRGQMNRISDIDDGGQPRAERHVVQHRAGAEQQHQLWRHGRESHRHDRYGGGQERAGHDHDQRGRRHKQRGHQHQDCGGRNQQRKPDRQRGG